jgi:hypothetical protein
MKQEQAMAKFLVLYNATASATEQMSNATPEEAKAGMDAWMTWASEAGERVVDLGMPLETRSRVTSGGATPTSGQASGYSILESDSLADVQALLAKHPHLGMAGSSIDVLELLQMPGM